MATIPQWRFGSFRLDAASGCLWRDDTLIALRPKPFALLAYLVAHAGQVVTKETLLEEVWSDVVVSEGVLKDYINQIRKVLGDTAHTSQYIATVHRRGYRFIAPVTTGNSVPPAGTTGQPQRPPAQTVQRIPVPDDLTRIIVGREAELAQLHRCWTQAREGKRQIVFVTGEAGIGKTTLVDGFMAQVEGSENVWIGQGQCIERHGAGEPYLPLLEALGRLGRGRHGGQLLELLRQHAPSWLVHLPTLRSTHEAEAVQPHGVMTRERMLRELAEVIEELTATRPLLLILEDLHWSDGPTSEWLDYMARRRGMARLLVVGTIRPLEAMLQAHPVRRAMHELLLHGHGIELALGYWSEASVAAYLERRFGDGWLPSILTPVLHQRTGGSPFFVVTMVDALVRQEILRQSAAGWELVEGLKGVTKGVPESLRHLIEQQLAQLTPDEQTLLEAASVVGREFTSAAVAAAVDQEAVSVEAHYALLARRGQFLRVSGVEDWADGTVSTCYTFVHDLYRETCYERIPASRRIVWHRSIGARLEAGYGAGAQDIAGLLAMHFERGRDLQQAMRYLRLAGENGLRRGAHREAIAHLTTGLELLATLPEHPERIQQELDFQVTLGPALIATKSQAAPEVEQTYARARALCAQIGETPQLFPTLQGLCEFYRNRGQLLTARELGEQLYRIAQRQSDPALQLDAHIALGTTCFHLGNYAVALSHFEAGLAVTDGWSSPATDLLHDVAPRVRCLALMANTLWCLGLPTQAERTSHVALALAQELGHPYSLALAHHFAALLYVRRRDILPVQAQAEALLALATTQEFPLYVAFARCYQGWVCAEQGQQATGLAQMRQGIAVLLATGLALSEPLWLALLAEALGRGGQIAEGQCLLADALAAFEASGRGDLRAEAMRLQGELLWRQGSTAAGQAETWFHRALETARRQQAKSWELRAATSLSRLWRYQGRRHEAHLLLAEVYDGFTEGHETADMRAAKVLLEELDVGG